MKQFLKKNKREVSKGKIIDQDDPMNKKMKNYENKNKRIVKTLNKTRNEKHESKPMIKRESEEHVLLRLYGDKISKYIHTKNQRKEMLEIFQKVNKSFRDEPYKNRKIKEIIDCIEDQGVYCGKCHEEHMRDLSNEYDCLDIHDDGFACDMCLEDHFKNKKKDDRCMYCERELKRFELKWARERSDREFERNMQKQKKERSEREQEIQEIYEDLMREEERLRPMMEWEHAQEIEGTENEIDELKEQIDTSKDKVEKDELKQKLEVKMKKLDRLTGKSKNKDFDWDDTYDF